MKALASVGLGIVGVFGAVLGFGLDTIEANPALLTIGLGAAGAPYAVGPAHEAIKRVNERRRSRSAGAGASPGDDGAP